MFPCAFIQPVFLLALPADLMVKTNASVNFRHAFVLLKTFNFVMSDLIYSYMNICLYESTIYTLYM